MKILRKNIAVVSQEPVRFFLFLSLTQRYIRLFLPQASMKIFVMEKKMHRKMKLKKQHVKPMHTTLFYDCPMYVLNIAFIPYIFLSRNMKHLWEKVAFN